MNYHVQDLPKCTTRFLCLVIGRVGHATSKCGIFQAEDAFDLLGKEGQRRWRNCWRETCLCVLQCVLQCCKVQVSVCFSVAKAATPSGSLQLELAHGSDTYFRNLCVKVPQIQPAYSEGD